MASLNEQMSQQKGEGERSQERRRAGSKGRSGRLYVCKARSKEVKERRLKLRIREIRKRKCASRNKK